MGQISLTPFVGINATKMSETYGMEKGGTYVLTGIEIEAKKRNINHKLFYISCVTGIGYLKNGYYNVTNFALPFADYYTQQITDLRMKYLQVPVELRLNLQPFPLIEDWSLFLGIGVSNSFLIETHLREESTTVNYTSGAPPPPPTTVHHEDSQDITALGKKHYLFTRFQIGFILKKIQFSYRQSYSMQDMYYHGIENSWNVPGDRSQYIYTHNYTGKTKENYSEIALGFRIH